MSDDDRQKKDFVEAARKQFAQVTAEFEKTLEGLKDPQRRKEMTSSYLDILQNGLSKAQEAVAKYQEKVGRRGADTDDGATTVLSPDSSATPSTPGHEAGSS